MTAFSEFIRYATVEEKEEIYNRVIKQSCLAQRKAIGIPTGEFIVSCYETQQVEDALSLAEIIDNAIGITMRVCWGLDNHG